MENCPLCNEKIISEDFIICVDNENDPGAGTLETKYGCPRLTCPLSIKNSMFTLENLEFIKEIFNKSNERSQFIQKLNEELLSVKTKVSEYQQEILDSKNKTLEYMDLLTESYKNTVLDKNELISVYNQLESCYVKESERNLKRIKEIDKEISFYKYSSYFVLFILIIIFIASFFI